MHGRRSRGGNGPDAWDSVSPKAQVFASLAVLVPVALSGLALVAIAPGLWWIFTTYFWIAFPALGLLARGAAGISGGAGMGLAGDGREREVLEALREHGELTPARAALETALTVAEASRVLERLAGDGHLEVRVRGSALYYALWDSPEGDGTRGGIRGSYGGTRLKLLESGGDSVKKDLERSGT